MKGGERTWLINVKNRDKRFREGEGDVLHIFVLHINQ